jgi:hypothetical protein
VVILQHPGHGLDTAARELLGQLLCTPGRQDGRPVATEMPYTLRFELPY